MCNYYKIFYYIHFTFTEVNSKIIERKENYVIKI